MIDIAAIKARADKVTDDRFSLAGTYFDHVTNMWLSGVHIDGHGGSGPAIVIKGNSVEFCNALRDFIAHARTDIPALIAALEASETFRVKAEQERDAARGKHFKSTIHNGVSAQFLKHDTKRITALEQERDALKEALAADINFLSQLASALVNKNSGAFKCAWTDYGEKLMQIVARRALEASK